MPAANDILPTQKLSDALAQLQPNYMSPALLGDYIDKPTLARELGRTIRILGRVNTIP
jgi:hypothetical protein